MTPPSAASPRVRVIVVSHNSGDLTLDCLRSVLASDWPAEHLQVVLVDNASTEPIVERVRREVPTVQVIASDTNRGFGAANNLALRDLRAADYFALVNNDATVAPGWLAPLVDALEADPAVGAACPKVLLRSSFVALTLRSSTHRRGRGDQRQLGVRVSGVRVGGTDVFGEAKPRRGFWGPEPGGEWTTGDAELLVPVPAGGASSGELRLDAEQPTSVDVGSGSQTARLDVGRDPVWFDVALAGPRLDVINSAGVEWTEAGFGADRGYLEPDDGRFDQPEDVPAWSGAAVLLRRAYLEDVGRFDERLFLYYEDLELAWRGQQRGWRYRYVPTSVVRHVHSATTVEASPRTMRLNERNRLLVLTRYGGYGRGGRAVARSALVTASYARRDLVAPVLRGQRPRTRIVATRLEALAGYARLVLGYRPRRDG